MPFSPWSESWIPSSTSSRMSPPPPLAEPEEETSSGFWPWNIVKKGIDLTGKPLEWIDTGLGKGLEAAGGPTGPISQTLPELLTPTGAPSSTQRLLSAAGRMMPSAVGGFLSLPGQLEQVGGVFGGRTQEYAAKALRPTLSLGTQLAIDPRSMGALSLLNPTLHKWLTVAFTGDMGIGAVHAAKATWKKFQEEGVSPDTVASAVEALGAGGFAVMGARGLRDLKPRVQEAVEGARQDNLHMQGPPTYEAWRRTAPEAEVSSWLDKTAPDPDISKLTPEGDVMLGNVLQGVLSRAQRTLMQMPYMEGAKVRGELPQIPSQVVFADALPDGTPVGGMGGVSPDGIIYINSRGRASILQASDGRSMLDRATDLITHEMTHPVVDQGRPTGSVDPMSGQLVEAPITGPKGHAGGGFYDDRLVDPQQMWQEYQLAEAMKASPEHALQARSLQGSVEAGALSLQAPTRASILAGTYSPESMELAEGLGMKPPTPTELKGFEADFIPPDQMAPQPEVMNLPPHRLTAAGGPLTPRQADALRRQAAKAQVHPDFVKALIAERKAAAPQVEQKMAGLPPPAGPKQSMGEKLLGMFTSSVRPAMAAITNRRVEAPLPEALKPPPVPKAINPIDEWISTVKSGPSSGRWTGDNFVIGLNSPTSKMIKQLATELKSGAQPGRMEALEARGFTYGQLRSYFPNVAKTLARERNAQGELSTGAKELLEAVAYIRKAAPRLSGTSLRWKKAEAGDQRALQTVVRSQETSPELSKLRTTQPQLSAKEARKLWNQERLGVTLQKSADSARTAEDLASQYRAKVQQARALRTTNLGAAARAMDDAIKLWGDVKGNLLDLSPGTRRATINESQNIGDLIGLLHAPEKGKLKLAGSELSPREREKKSRDQALVEKVFKALVQEEPGYRAGPKAPKTEQAVAREAKILAELEAMPEESVRQLADALDIAGKPRKEEIPLPKESSLASRFKMRKEQIKRRLGLAKPTPEPSALKSIPKGISGKITRVGFPGKAPTVGSRGSIAPSQAEREAARARERAKGGFRLSEESQAELAAASREAYLSRRYVKPIPKLPNRFSSLPEGERKLPREMAGAQEPFTPRPVREKLHEEAGKVTGPLQEKKWKPAKEATKKYPARPAQIPKGFVRVAGKLLKLGTKSEVAPKAGEHLMEPGPFQRSASRTQASADAIEKILDVFKRRAATGKNVGIKWSDIQQAGFGWDLKGRVERAFKAAGVGPDGKPVPDARVRLTKFLGSLEEFRKELGREEGAVTGPRYTTPETHSKLAARSPEGLAKLTAKTELLKGDNAPSPRISRVVPLPSMSEVKKRTRRWVTERAAEEAASKSEKISEEIPGPVEVIQSLGPMLKSVAARLGRKPFAEDYAKSLIAPLGASGKRQLYSEVELLQEHIRKVEESAPKVFEYANKTGTPQAVKAAEHAQETLDNALKVKEELKVYEGMVPESRFRMTTLPGEKGAYPLLQTKGSKAESTRISYNVDPNAKPPAFGRGTSRRKTAGQIENEAEAYQQILEREKKGSAGMTEAALAAREEKGPKIATSTVGMGKYTGAKKAKYTPSPPADILVGDLNKYPVPWAKKAPTAVERLEALKVQAPEISKATQEFLKGKEVEASTRLDLERQVEKWVKAGHIPEGEATTVIGKLETSRRAQATGAAGQKLKLAGSELTPKESVEAERKAYSKARPLIEEAGGKLAKLAANLTNAPALKEAYVGLGGWWTGKAGTRWEPKKLAAYIDLAQLGSLTKHPQKFADIVVDALLHELGHAETKTTNRPHAFAQIAGNLPLREGIKIGKKTYGDVTALVPEKESSKQFHSTEHGVKRAQYSPREFSFELARTILTHNPEVLKITDKLRQDLADPEILAGVRLGGLPFGLKMAGSSKTPREAERERIRSLPWKASKASFEEVKKLPTLGTSPFKPSPSDLKVQSWIDKVGEGINITRPIKTAIDFSNVFRNTWQLSTDQLFQDIVQLAQLKAPKEGGLAKNMKDMVSAAFSEKADAHFRQMFEADPYYQLASEKGLRFVRGKDVAEGFLGKGALETWSKKVLGETLSKVITLPVDASNRAYNFYQNKAMLDAFKYGVKGFGEVGRSTAEFEAFLPDLVKHINNAASRGKVTGSPHLDKVLNYGLYSANMNASRVRMLGHALTGFSRYATKDARSYARMQTLRSMAGGVALTGLAYTIAKLQGEDPKIERDALSTDFGKVRMGGAVFDGWGGLQQFIVRGKQVLYGKRKELGSGRISEQSPLATVARFARSKAGPGVGYLVSFLEKRTGSGEALDYNADPTGFATTTVKELLEPMSISDTNDIIESNPRLAWLIPLMLLGNGVSADEGAKGKWLGSQAGLREKDRALQKELSKFKMSGPRLSHRVTLPGKDPFGRNLYYRLSPGEVAKFENEYMPLVTQLLNEFVTSPAYQALPESKKPKALYSRVHTLNEKYGGAKRLKKEYTSKYKMGKLKPSNANLPEFVDEVVKPKGKGEAF